MFGSVTIPAMLPGFVQSVFLQQFPLNQIISESDDPSGICTVKFIEAIKYAHNQREKFPESRMTALFRITSPDNFAAERAIRDFAVSGHSTSGGFASIAETKALAMFTSFHKICKQYGVNLKALANLTMTTVVSRICVIAVKKGHPGKRQKHCPAEIFLKETQINQKATGTV